ncbi:Ppx/GppA phosphatase family-domain-containing protein [Dactylonectria estremocensis]|uniref:Ppx/GppA phosphatase family-domain-containing protein n=1 Tax=Dactylonectria estremocensis TaxID=1079267 RepID=A0A9P9DXK7_9HYPO|nr:Ppx/GppA phosphatase family-domain-containing protein [Dactylonectria estremocensis]
MDFSDFEEVDTPSESDGEQPRDELELSEALMEKLTFPQPIQPPPAHLLGGHPPWRGHAGKLIGVVDMGSNGIRLSISDLSPPMARILPTVLVYRSGISLYDSQFDPETGEQVPIPDDVIESVCSVLSRFVVVCGDFGCTKENIHVIATEATRAAVNSKQFLKAIKDNTDLTVELLPKEEEGQIGALGIASGFSSMEGLVMDLGGGSTQITWMLSQGADIRISPRGSFSFPYGAAALTKKLADLRQGKSKEEGEAAVTAFRSEMIQNFRDAYHSLQVPEELVEVAEREGGFRIYLSGGGFRGWGYLLLYLNQSKGKHYPISVINGYTAGREQFQDTESLKAVARAAKNVFRVSDRRRSQVPAVAFLINVLAEAIPHGLKEAHFCQGGVREGFLFKQLSPSVRMEAPLEVATSYFAPGSRHAIQTMLKNAIPKPSRNGLKKFPEAFGEHVIDSFANSMYTHMFMSKETASATALYSTSVGTLSTVHGVSHQDRARLALMLESRYGGELPPREVEFRDSLRNLIPDEEVWWASYLGKVGTLITTLYPAGKVNKTKPRVVVSAQWSWTLGKTKDKEGLILNLSVQKTKNDPARTKETLEEYGDDVEKVGKAKHWAGDEEPWGMKVKVKIVEEGILSGPEF